MSTSRRYFTQEFKDELCREVIDTSKPIKDVATAYGVGSDTVRNWLIKYRDANGGTEEDLTVSQLARMKELENLNPVSKMCRWLEVSTSGFYYWLARPRSATTNRRESLTKRIRHYFEESEGTYGYRRLHADLTAEVSTPRLIFGPR